jgi:5-methylcytosine-specific restriction endonuclease McrA
MPYKNKEDFKKYQNEWRKKDIVKRKQKVKERLGNKCSFCGKTEDLEFDHIDHNLKYKQRGVANNWWYSNVKIEETIDNIQLLCKKCHREKSAAERRASWQVFISLPIEERIRLTEEQIKNPSKMKNLIP